VSRGRPRLFDKTVPAHIEQAKIPSGAYWSRGDRVWYTFIDEGGKRRRRKLAGPEAKLSDLHRLLEDFAGVNRGALGWLCDQFHASAQFAALAETSRESYESDRRVVATYRIKSGALLAELPVRGLSTPFIQRLIDKIAEEHPSKANHLVRYLSRVFSWGIQRGHCKENPAKGVQHAKERKLRRLPSQLTYMNLLQHAQRGAALTPHTKGAISPYVWIVMELAFLCRLRRIEVITLTDANETEEGIQTNRRKGSRDTLVLWSPRLRSAWQTAQAERRRIWEKLGKPTPMRPEDRPALVNQKGEPITKSGMKTIWATFNAGAIKAGVITAEDRFGLHDLKRKGITDTKGDRAAKQEGSGHKNAAMLDVYDLSVPRVTTPGDV